MRILEKIKRYAAARRQYLKEVQIFADAERRLQTLGSLKSSLIETLRTLPEGLYSIGDPWRQAADVFGENIHWAMPWEASSEIQAVKNRLEEIAREAGWSPEKDKFYFLLSKAQEEQKAKKLLGRRWRPSPPSPPWVERGSIEGASSLTREEALSTQVYRLVTTGTCVEYLDERVAFVSLDGVKFFRVEGSEHFTSHRADERWENTPGGYSKEELWLLEPLATRAKEIIINVEYNNWMRGRKAVHSVELKYWKT
jgi:hypothetical protein